MSISVLYAFGRENGVGIAGGSIMTGKRSES